MKQKIVLATGNKGKVKEMADVLADFGFEVIAQTDLGIESPEETGLTFVENAILKARYASEKSGLPAIADDSGLVVDALKELEEKAYALGANAIVGVEVNYTTVGTKSMFMVIASGTAVVVR